jgi:hypothetical protein
MSPGSRSGTSGSSSTPHPVDSSHETTQTSTSHDESTGPHLQRPASRNQAHASENHLSSRDHHLLQPGRANMMPETPNSLPPITPISIEATAPAIYSPFPLPHPASQQSHSIDRSPSIRSPPRATSPTAGKPVKSRGINSSAVGHDPTFSPWSLLHSPTVPEAMRAPIVVNTMRPSPISAPLSEIDLVTRAPPAINAVPSYESQTAQPILRRLGTLRDLLEEPSMQGGSRLGTPTGEARYSNEVSSPCNAELNKLMTTYRGAHHWDHDHGKKRILVHVHHLTGCCVALCDPPSDVQRLLGPFQSKFIHL